METSNFCQFCRASVSEVDYFCPNCGKKIKDTPFSLTRFQIIKAYIISFLIPPAGLYYGFKYLKQTDEKVRKVGKIAIVLTLISLLLSFLVIVFSYKIANDIVNQTYQNLPSGFQDLGY